MNKTLYTAIVFIKGYRVPVIKYRKIGNAKSFIEFVRNKYPGAYKINFYNRSTRAFSHQEKLP